MQDSFDMTTLVFIALAIFVAWRLRSVLGQKTGHEQPPVPPFKRNNANDTEKVTPRQADNVVQLPGAERLEAIVPAADRWKAFAEPDSPIARGLDAVAAVEADFDAQGFLGGAKGAYEMIVTAYAAGDRKALKPLLSKDVFEGFEREIAVREKTGQKVESTFVSIDRAKFAAVEVKGRTAQITIDFSSKLITATRDASGSVIEGSPEAVIDVNDVWTFARTLASRDPNWLLVATEPGQ
jgi:predicted lipid-binding transport protein (Tim44 family)